jgi:hypothetical protein
MSCNEYPILPEGLSGSAVPEQVEMRELFGPSNPILGMNTYRDPSLLGGENVEELLNVTQVPGALIVRPPMIANLPTTGLPGAFTVLGSHFGVNGYYLGIGWNDSGTDTGSVFRWNPGGNTWVEITQTTNPYYGRTRLLSRTLPIYFQVVKETWPSGIDGILDASWSIWDDTGDESYIIWQNGAEPARVANTSLTLQTGTYREVAVAHPIKPPQQDLCKATPTWSYYTKINSLDNHKVESAAVRMSATHVNGSTGYYWEVVIQPTVLAGDSVTLYTSSDSLYIMANDGAFDRGETRLGGTHQLVYSANVQDIWDNLAVALQTSGTRNVGTTASPWGGGAAPPITEFCFHHPLNTSLKPKVGQASGGEIATSVSQVMFDKSQAYDIVTGYQIAYPVPAGNLVNGIKLRWVGAAPRNAITLRIFASGGTDIRAAGASNVEYGAQFRLSYFCQGVYRHIGATVVDYMRAKGGSRVESASSAVEINRTPKLESLGGTAIPNLRLAEQAGFLYEYRIFYPPNHVSSNTNPVTHVCIYAKFTNSSQFRLVQLDFRAGLQSGVWKSDIRQFAGTLTRGYSWMMHDELPTNRRAPDFSQISIPTGDLMFSTGKRLAVANAKHDAVETSPGRLSLSESGYPFRFLTAVRFDGSTPDPESAFDVTVAPGERIQIVKPLSTSTIGFDQLAIITDLSVYTLEAAVTGLSTNIRYRNEFGTTYANSAVSYRGAVIYLDRSNIIRVFDGSTEELSRGQIDRTLAAIAGTANVVGGTVDDKYMALWTDPLNAAQSIGVVFDFRLGKWSLRRYPRAISSMTPLTIGGKLQLWGVTSLGETVRIEASGASGDMGASVIPVLVDFGELVAPPGADIVIGDVSVRADAGAYTLTTRRTTPANVDGTLSLTGAGTVWKLDQSGGGLPVAASAPTVGLQVFGDLPSGHKITNISAQIGGVNGGATR